MEEINPFQSSDAGLWYSLPLRQVLQSSIRVARHTVLASDDCFCFHPLISEQFQFWLEVCWGRGGGVAGKMPAPWVKSVSAAGEPFGLARGLFSPPLL